MQKSPFVTSSINSFKYYKQLGDRAMEQLDNKSLFYQHHQDSNSMAIMVKHLWGNMLSRWTDFLISDGEKEWRKRDEEFENNIQSREELLKIWEEGWTCLFNALESLTDNDLQRNITIRSENHLVLEAINRQLCHYAYHVGQMVFLAKLLKGENWKSLSIPRGGSKEFNQKMFGTSK